MKPVSTMSVCIAIMLFAPVQVDERLGRYSEIAKPITI